MRHHHAAGEAEVEGWRRRAPLVTSILVGAVVGMIGLFWVWALFWPFNPLTIESITVPSQVKNDTSITYTLKYCKTTDQPSVLHRGLIGVDGTHTIYSYPLASGVIPQGCSTKSIALPPIKVVPGHYKIIDTVTYSPAPYRTIYIHSQSNEFEVVP